MLRRASPQWRRTATPLALALVSLVAAVGLWIAVTEAENPRRIAVFGGAIEVKPVNVPEGLAVARIDKSAVTLRISAADDTFRELTTADFVAEIDLSGVRETSDQVVIARVVGRDDVKIVEVSPSIVSVTLEPEATKQVPVRANRIGAPPQGYSVTTVAANPETVRVRGATSLVQLVDSAAADINLTGVQLSRQQQYSLTPRDQRGADISRVRVEPASAEIRITVVQEVVTLSLLVVPQLQGSLAEGYNLVSINVDPPAIGVTGPLTVLQSLSQLTTEPIDVNGLRGDLTRTLRLRLPAEVQATRDSVTVLLRVAPAEGEILMTVAPQVAGVAEGLKATLQTASISLRLRGQMPTLAALTPDSVKTTVSAAGLAEGVYVLIPAIGLPANVQIVSAEPPTVVLILSR